MDEFDRFDTCLNILADLSELYETETRLPVIKPFNREQVKKIL